MVRRLRKLIVVRVSERRCSRTVDWPLNQAGQPNSVCGSYAFPGVGQWPNATAFYLSELTLL